jgi:small subunit ribosomal protein S9
VTDESTPAPAEDATASEDAVSEAAAAEPEAAGEETPEAPAADAETPSAESVQVPAAEEAAPAAEDAAPAAEASTEEAAPVAEASAEEAAPAAEEAAPAVEASTEETAPAAEEAAPAAEASTEEASEAGAPAAATEDPQARPAPRRAPASKGGKPIPSLGTGRRKGAVARVRLIAGSGQFDLNGRSLEDVFPNRAHRMQITAPLRIADRERDLDVLARLHGGGVSGQAGALRHGITRALIELDPELRGRMKAEGFLTRDSREKERRKYGLKKARKAPQYSKR